MARLGRSPSRNSLSHVEDNFCCSHLVLKHTLAASPQGSSCTCGAGEQLDAERQRIVQRSQDLNERGENLVFRESELEQRVVNLEARQADVSASAEGLRLHHAQFDAKLAGVDSLLREVAKRQDAARRWEKSLGEQVAAIEALEIDTKAKEETLAKEELHLIEERNRIEEELSNARQQLSALDMEVETYSRQDEVHSCRRAEIEKEMEMLCSDELLINEIEEQIEPIRQSLCAREMRIADEERKLSEREAECQMKENSILPEWEHSILQLERFEERAKELAHRDAESNSRRERLIQRQRDLGGYDESPLASDSHDWIHKLDKLDARVESLGASPRRIFKSADVSKPLTVKDDRLRAKLRST